MNIQYDCNTILSFPAPFLVLDEHLARTELKDNGCNTLRFPGKGVRFTYDYAGKTMSQVAGSTTRTTGLTLTAKVSISQTATCQFIMEVGIIYFVLLP